MSIAYVPTDEVARIRARLDHPVIDNDGHIIEFLPLVRDIIVDLAGESVAQGFDRVTNGGRASQQVPIERRRELGMTRSAWWGVPTHNTLDRATAMLPELMYRRLDEMGVDVAFLYPTYGLTAIHMADDELRQVMSRAFNIYLAEVYAPYADAGPAGVIGELSYAAAVALGIDPDPNRGGVEGDVTYIVFTGDDARVEPVESAAQARAVGERLLARLLDRTGS